MSYPSREFAADPRVRRGMEAQLARRRVLLDGGEEPLGWKVGFGTPSAFERFGTTAPMVGYLLRSGLVEAGRPVPLSGWSQPALEAEVAAHMASDLPAGADTDAAHAAIGALGPAFELADLDPSADDVESVLEANVFQRAVVLGARVAGIAPGELSATVARAGDEPVQVDDPQAATGQVVAIVHHVADLLGAFGERLRAGEVIITGAVTPPPIPVSAGDRYDYELRPLGRISIAFE